MIKVRWKVIIKYVITDEVPVMFQALCCVCHTGRAHLTPQQPCEAAAVSFPF